MIIYIYNTLQSYQHFGVAPRLCAAYAQPDLQSERGFLIACLALNPNALRRHCHPLRAEVQKGSCFAYGLNKVIKGHGVAGVAFVVFFNIFTSMSTNWELEMEGRSPGEVLGHQLSEISWHQAIG